MSRTIICPQCGTELPENTRFCSECGYPVQPEFGLGAAPGGRPGVPPTQKVDEYPPYAPPVSPEPAFGYTSGTPKTSRSRPLLIGAGILMGICCLVVIGVSLFAAMIGGDGFSIALFSSPTPSATLTPTPTNTPIPTQAPPPTQPPVNPPSSGSQRLTDTEMFDDFSTTNLNWYVTEDDQAKVGYEAGGYVIQVKQADFRQLTHPPLETMSHIEFNAQVMESPENGAFGVACYYEDIQNYHYVEFYLPSREYRVGRIENGEWIQITEWAGFAFASEPLKYGVDCTAGAMAIYINDTLMVQTPVDQPDAPGEIWLFTMAWSDSSGGMKVLFDNIYGYLARQ